VTVQIHPKLGRCIVLAVMCRSELKDASKEGACPLKLIVDSSTIMKTPASTSTFRIGWAPLLTARAARVNPVRYDVKFICVETGKSHTFRTPDDLPGVVLQNALVRKKVGATFSVRIRVVSSDGVGEWSETSEVMHAFFVAKPSSYLPLATIAARPKTPKRAQPSPSELAKELEGLEALPYIAKTDTPVKKCGDATKRPGSFLDRFMSKFRRPTATVLAIGFDEWHHDNIEIC